MKKRILCYGDSNTWGFSPEEYKRMDERWTRNLSLNKDQVEIIEEGLNGRNAVCIDTFQPEKCGFKDFKRALISHQPLDLIVLMLGTNDLKSSYHSSARFIANGIRQYVCEYLNPTLFEGMPKPELLVISPILLDETLPEIVGPAGNFNSYSVAQSKLLAQEIKQAIAPYPVHFMNAAEFASPSKIDGIHMDEKNHGLLAKAITKKIQENFPELD
ncbi:GDSL-type esterase/lipase family protein [Ileibacterium valens]|uniref:SGNH hydrolase-type esterase domain-containing protein n=1 Tax=Ileibacterium valens TaxID=1862668 RepID=A0A1U7NIT9_9FIRM|nr:GDSL-type esterase/lipase family protein [Ileibacterium valens]OLU36257.1 hypothetical protein BM735_12675 [Erysipelotrichaceae bacterium NYU-BL-F16]OLU42653.1 hypothetical protein BO222_01220 [Ileibacterium valens]OLU43407.1 hypothetical protein BO224_00165 [Erysipelotrichaceae bacterium NYU-BL-E8]